MPERVMENFDVTVKGDRIYDQLVEAHLNTAFSYSADLADITLANPPKERVGLALLENSNEINGTDLMFVIDDLVKSNGLQRGNIFQLIALARDAPKGVQDRPILASANLFDFTNDLNFPREFYPYLERKDGVVKFGLFQNWPERIYGTDWLYLAGPGSGQPMLISV